MGFTPTASAECVLKFNRKLATKLRPDLNSGNPEAEEKFKEAAGIYTVVGDAQRRGLLTAVS
jgi:molecular chaperone DnaJ